MLKPFEPWEEWKQRTGFCQQAPLNDDGSINGNSQEIYDLTPDGIAWVKAQLG